MAESVVTRSDQVSLTRRDALLAALAVPLVMRDAPAFAETKKRAAPRAPPPRPPSILRVPPVRRRGAHEKGWRFPPHDGATRRGTPRGRTTRCPRRAAAAAAPSGFKEELAHGGTAALDKAVARTRARSRASIPDISYADLAYVGVVAIETMGGPKLKFYGRVDEMDPAAVTPDGRLLNADVGDGPGPKERDHLRAYLQIADPTTRRSSRSAPRRRPSMPRRRLRVRRPVVRNPAALQQQLLRPAQGFEVGAQRRGGQVPVQGSQPPAHDAAERHRAIEDAKFKKYVDVYAKDQKKFFADFAAAFGEAGEPRTSGLTPLSA